MELTFTFAILLALINFSNGQTQTTQIPTTTSTRPHLCQNGGTCKAYNATGYCTCNCPMAYSGDQCQLVLTQVIGSVAYSRQANSTSQPVNGTAVQELIVSSLTPSLTNVRVEAMPGGSTNVNIQLKIYFERPSVWKSFADWLPFEARVRSDLQLPASMENIFGNANVATFRSLQLDVQECYSMWHTCDANATCFNTQPGFRCVCERGYSGNGTICTAIECQLSRVPATPSFATRQVFADNGTELTDPPATLSFGALVEFTCPRHYILADSVTGDADPVVVQCGGTPKYAGSNWSGASVTCNIDTSLKIAVVVSVISILIIIAVSGAFLVNYCVKRERRAKEDRRLREEELGGVEEAAFDNRSFDFEQ